MVGGDVGAVSLRLVLVGTLDLGHDVYAASADLPVSAGFGIAELAGLARLAALRGIVWHWGAGKSYHAGLPSLLRPLDLAAAIPPRAVFSRRRRACFRRIFSCAGAVAGTEL